MGIPRFFANLIKKYPQILKKQEQNQSVKVNNFLIDFNALIYNILPTIDSNVEYSVFENKLIDGVILNLKILINKIAATDSVYIAMDGVPPIAKMKQQRFRRFKAVFEQNYFKVTKKWSTSSISPGTVFMDKLSRKLYKEFTSPIIHISDSLEPGEGEHKLLRILKDLKGTTVLYSPDADLIVLSVLSGGSNIHLLKYDDEGILVMLNIDILKNYFIAELNLLQSTNDVDAQTLLKHNNRVLIDYCFLTFLCGNDFVPSVPFMKIKEGGLETLIEIYNEIEHYLVNENYTINLKALQIIINKLAEDELDRLKRMQRKVHYTRKNGSKNDNENDNVIKFNHLEFYNKNHPLHKEYNHIFDIINYYDENWNTKYNSFFFGKEDINNVCMEYIKSLKFCLDYYVTSTRYNDDKLDWLFYYKYRTSPTFGDLKKFLEENIENLGTDLDTKSDNKPLTPFEQLLIILPKEHSFLVPKCLQGFFKKVNIKLDVMHGIKYIYTEPLLPEQSDVEVVRSYISQFKFNDLDTLRNTNKQTLFTKKA